eukprot:scaffold143592_cov37-Prasinocladus_malaysianus.AAC.1
MSNISACSSCHQCLTCLSSSEPDPTCGKCIQCASQALHSSWVEMAEALAQGLSDRLRRALQSEVLNNVGQSAVEMRDCEASMRKCSALNGLQDATEKDGFYHAKFFP